MEKAIELYNAGEISIGKAAEIANMSTSDFKEMLAERGNVRFVKSMRSKNRKI